jgi:hypothetical protein
MIYAVWRADADAGPLGHGVGREACQSAGFQNLSRSFENRRHGFLGAGLPRNSAFHFNGLARLAHGAPCRPKTSAGT